MMEKLIITEKWTIKKQKWLIKVLKWQIPTESSPINLIRAGFGKVLFCGVTDVLNWNSEKTDKISKLDNKKTKPANKSAKVANTNGEFANKLDKSRIWKGSFL
ncbi:hypothetical protein [Litchfieldia alkalitelluris]|uniref:hypothetical protein n=1 Tax=Litchfieldia alkalitelluris TaxID=304268 RepID=UPI000998B853|nr:hypothetical protein [Litchfieldia alkalitelluris]